MFGWQGKLLRVNLSNGAINEETLDIEDAKNYIGGRGLGVCYLNRELNPQCDPLGSENILIMATGPLTGTRAPTGARYMVMTKSPLTGAITCSNSGGLFPAELKKTGYDMIIFEGVSPNPVYLWIHDGIAELRPADALWGLTTHETDRAIREQLGKSVKVACIGPAGEKQVLFASIMNDKDRAAGRSGVGAVMGAKKLKAVAVKASKEVAIWDPEAFDQAVDRTLKRFNDALKGKPPLLRLHGTAVTVVATNNAGVFPTRNFQQGTFEHWESIQGETLTKKYLKHTKPCYSCPISCGRVTKVDDPDFKGEGEGPEYETVYALGSNCGIDNLAALTKANYICNEMGLDTISMGSTLACAMELYERGIIPESDIGKPLRFGDPYALVEFTMKTAQREGFGNVLAQGSFRLAQRYGHPELAMVSKKQDFAGYDPRGEQGMGLAYATSPIGASHMRGDPAYIELLGVPFLIDPHTWEDKAQLVKDWQDVFAVIDSAGLCVFFSVRYLTNPTRQIEPQGILDLINAATGVNYSLEELILAGERIFNTERQLIVKAGFSRKDDTLPPRMTQEPLPDGPAKGKVCHLNEMLDRYYQIREWDQDGIPSPEKLKKLKILLP